MFEYLASIEGRNLRIALGLVVIVIGLLIVKESAGLLIAVIGLVPLLAALADVCLLAPLAGKPLSGYQIRHHQQHPAH